MLKYRTLRFRVGDVEVRLKTLRDLGQTSDDMDEARRRGISVEAFPVFGVVWPSSRVLAAMLLQEQIAGRRVLEVGCGMALTSHVLNAAGADVTAMDIHPLAGELLERNARLNRQPPIPFIDGNWANAYPDIGTFDLIVAGDVLYEPRHVKTLPDFLDRHLSARGEVLMVDPARGHLEMFEEMMDAIRFESVPIPLDDFDGQGRRFTRRQ